LLKPYQLDTRIIEEQEATLLTAVNKDCYKGTEAELVLLEDIQAEDIGLIDRILQANRTSNTLADLRIKAGESEDWKIENRLLQYRGRLVIPEEDTLYTDLIKEVYTQLSTVHPGRNKTCRIIVSRYYWPGLLVDIARYICNCYKCRRATVPRDRPPGLLYLLPIPEHL
jgi:hypothetical protein